MSNLERRQPILRHFEFGHLPPHLQDISGDCHELAHTMVTALDDSPELTAGLRKLLEAKDCFVRAAVEQDKTRSEPPGGFTHALG